MSTICRGLVPGPMCCYVSGCTDSNALNYDSNACYDDGSCIQPVLGCTDPSAANFDLGNVAAY